MVTPGFFQNDLSSPVANVQRLGKHTGSRPFNLRLSLAGATVLLQTQRGRTACRPSKFPVASVAGDAPVDFSGTVKRCDRGNYGQVVNGVLHSRQESMKRLLLQLLQSVALCCWAASAYCGLASAIKRRQLGCSIVFP